MADQPDAFNDQGDNTNQPNQNTDPNNQGGNTNNQEPTSSNQNPQNPDDVFADQLTSITNEDGKPKYDSVQEALKALQHSQEYIPNLKTELEQYREEAQRLKEELNKRESVEDVVERLTKGRQQESQNTNQTDQSQVGGLDEQTAKQLFNQMLEEKEAQRSYESNRQTVNSALYEMYGEKTTEQVKNKAEELGTTPKQLGELASQNPKMVLELFNTGPSKGPKPTTNSINNHNYEKNEELKPPEKSLLGGSTSKDQKDYWQKVKADTYRRLNVETS